MPSLALRSQKSCTESVQFLDRICLDGMGRDGWLDIIRSLNRWKEVQNIQHAAPGWRRQAVNHSASKRFDQSSDTISTGKFLWEEKLAHVFFWEASRCGSFISAPNSAVLEESPEVHPSGRVEYWSAGWDGSAQQETRHQSTREVHHSVK